MALNPTKTASNPRIAKLIELEVAGRIKPEHQQELDTYRAQGMAPARASAGGTEGERKGSAFLTRAVGANRSYEATKVGPRSMIGQSFNDAFPNAANTFVNDADRQVADSAQDEFIAASLRQDSGAAIPEDELERQRRIYFPMPGDEPATMEQKRQARLRAISGLENAAGGSLSETQRTALAPMKNDINQAVTGEVQFGDEGPAKSANSYRMSPENERSYLALAQAGASQEQLAAYAKSIGAGVDPENLRQVAEFYRDPAHRKLATSVDYSKVDEIKPVQVKGEGTTAASVRGLADTVTLGALPRLGAIVDTVANGGTYADNLDRNRGIIKNDEQQHPLARIAGQVAGGFALPTFGASGAAELARIGAGYGGAYGLLSSDQDLTSGSGLARAAGDAGIQALIGAGVGYGAGRIGEGLAARSAARGPRGDQPDPRLAARQIASAADTEGVRLLPADLGSAGVSRQTAAAQQTPFGARIVDNAAQDSVESFRGAAGRMAGQAGDVSTPREVGENALTRLATLGTRARNSVSDVRSAVVDSTAMQDATGAGQAAQRGANAFIERTGNRATQLYSRIPIAPNADASLTNTRTALADLTQGMESNPELGAMFENTRLAGYLEALTPQVDPETGQQISAGQLSWNDLTQLRTRVGDMMDEPRLSEKIAPRQLRALYGALSSDMEQTARSQGESAYRAWRRANDFYDGRQKRIDTTMSLLLGQRRDATANEAFGQVERLARNAAGGDFGNLGRIFRSLPREDAAILRASILGKQGEGPGGFSAEQFSKDWSRISDRAKSYLLPEQGQRAMMDSAAERAANIASNPFEGMSGEKVFSTIERMAQKGGDSAGFARTLNALSPDEAGQIRATIFSQMGRARAGGQNADDTAFSPSKFLTDWNAMSVQGRDLLAGRSGTLRESMDRLAQVANSMKSAQRMAGHSNTGGVNAANATNGMVLGAMGALLTGHPIVAAGLSAPAIAQNLSARVFTSPALVRWMTRAVRQPRDNGVMLRELGAIAARQPALRADIVPLQRLLTFRPEGASAALAADERQPERQAR